MTSVVMSQCGNWALSSSRWVGWFAVMRDDVSIVCIVCRDGMVAVWKLWVDDEDQVFKNQLFCSFKVRELWSYVSGRISQYTRLLY